MGKQGKKGNKVGKAAVKSAIFEFLLHPSLASFIFTRKMGAANLSFFFAKNNATTQELQMVSIGGVLYNAKRVLNFFISIIFFI